MLDKGALLLDAIERFEEENAEFLQYNPTGQDELNKRKRIIQYVLFPIIDDDKVAELLQYHLLEAISAELDIEELMRMRAISTSELLWPKLSQQYLKALTQNTQLIGNDPISLAGEKTSFLPYIKNWISLYNRRFGIEKHSGLEPHQFALEDPNAQKLGKDLKEKLLVVLRFYESLKVYSLSEIENELRKMQLGFSAQQATAYSLSKDIKKNPVRQSNPVVSLGNKTKIGSNNPSTPEEIAAIQKEVMRDKRIKIVKGDYTNNYNDSKKILVKPENKNIAEKSSSTNKPALKEIENENILGLIEKYPFLQSHKITTASISLPIAPFSVAPTIQNWIQYYWKECGKGKHSFQERESFIEKLKKTQNISPVDIQKLEKIFRSIDEKSTLPFDKKKGELLLDLVRVGQKLKTDLVTGTIEKKALESFNKTEKQQPIMKMGASSMSRIETTSKDEGYLDLELVPTENNSDTVIK
jgi:hypothetical protein